MAKKEHKSINSRLLYITTKIGSNKAAINHRYTKIISFSQKHPFSAFFIALGILLFVIITGSAIFRTKPTEEIKRTQLKEVEVFRLGESPTIEIQGQVSKSGVVKIVAQTPGIVNAINVNEGVQVSKGKILINLSSNYQGGNAFSLQRQIASLQYQNTKDTYNTQSDLIVKQRDLINKQSDNSEELKKITQSSIDETQTLVDLNTTILNKIKTNIGDLESSNIGGVNDQSILSLQQLQAQIQGGTNQLQASLRTNRYQVDEDKPTQDMEDINKDVALKQIEIQEKALKLALEISAVQLKLAQVQESTMFPVSPLNATVQKVHVKLGDNVNPGTPLVTLAGDNGEILIDAKVNQSTAANLSTASKAKISVNGKTIDTSPSFISTEATSGQLYSVIFCIDQKYRNLFTDNAFVRVILPVGISNTGVNFIPVDSVFQTQDEAYVFVLSGNKAKSKKITLGEITGGYVLVESGLESTDAVILNRNIAEGETVKPQN
jgi:multidrug efflux pump subunit AcrA (membrane-fusion protein)